MRASIEVAVVALAAVFASASAAGQGPDSTRQSQALAAAPRELSVKLNAAAAAEAAGEPARAVAQYRDAMQRAAAPDVAPSVRAGVALNYAQAIQSWASTAPAGAACRGDAGASESCDAVVDGLYRKAVNQSVGPQRALASNNYGAWLLERERYAEALEVLAGIELPADPRRRAVYEYNQARALELSGRGSEALQRYLDLTHSQPNFTPAAEGAARLLRAAPAPDAKLCAELVTALLSSGQVDAAERATRALLRGPVTGLWGAALVGLRLRYEVAARLPRPRLLEEQKLLASLSMDRSVRQEVGHVDRVLRDTNLPLIRNADEAFGAFAVVDTPDAVRPFAAFVKYVGDVFGEERQYPQALRRYLLAWQLDPSQGESAVYAASLIRSHPEADPGQAALDALLSDIFARKSAYIIQHDWPNSLNLHIVLGHIFESLERWGPASDPRTALYQWKAAVADEERIRRDNALLSPSAGLYESLALAYRHTGDAANAARFFQRAETAFRTVGRPADAERVARLAASSPAGR